MGVVLCLAKLTLDDFHVFMGNVFNIFKSLSVLCLNINVKHSKSTITIAVTLINLLSFQAELLMIIVWTGLM